MTADLAWIVAGQIDVVPPRFDNAAGRVYWSSADAEWEIVGSGIDAVSEILASFDIPVIFITAYPEKLLTGERPEPTYLIAKPFLPETVQATVGQALFFHPVAKQAA